MNDVIITARRSGSTPVGRLGTLVAVLVACFSFLAVASATASADPTWDVKAIWGDTNLPPGGDGSFRIYTYNVGETDGTDAADLTLTDQFPPGVTITAMGDGQGPAAWVSSGYCSGTGTSTLTCTMPAADVPGKTLANGTNNGFFLNSPDGKVGSLWVDVSIAPGTYPGTETNTATLSGGGGSSTASDVDQVPFNATASPFGVVPGSLEADVFDNRYPFGAPVRYAGSHPRELRTNFDMTEQYGIGVGDEPFIFPKADTREADVTLPKGMYGNPEYAPKCTAEEFAGVGVTGSSTHCPSNTQIGYIDIAFGYTESEHGNPFLADWALRHIALYNMVPPVGEPADLAFNAGLFVQGHIYPNLDAGSNYAIKATTPDISSFVHIRGARVTIWGVPGDPSHDWLRYTNGDFQSAPATGAPFTAPVRPFLTSAMDCGFDNGTSKIQAKSYQNPDTFTPPQFTANAINVGHCDDPRIRFNPQVTLQPTDRHAGAPTGLDVHLKLPQRSDTVDNASDLYTENGDVQAMPTPPIKKIVVTLPEAMTISTSAAQGLGNCSSEQVGLGTDKPVTCPDNSQYGTLTLHTPLLPSDAPMQGQIFIAKQNDNPFHDFLGMYFIIDDPSRGLLVKIPGHIELDPRDGTIKTTFDNMPQFPISDMNLTFKGGARSALVNPSTCGTKTISADFYSWADPNTPVHVDDNYEITQKPDGSKCNINLSDRQFKPQFSAGTVSNTAGSFSPFVFRLTRTDDDQEISQLGTTLAQGLTAKIAGVTKCSDMAILAASDPARTGAQEQAQPSCPETSLLGETDIGTGVGVPLAYIPGRVYLAGPYKGSPLSLAIITPVLSGPYDLGVLAVRTGIDIDHSTAQVHVLTDPFPQIYQGLPVRIRDIRFRMDRPNTMLNPTSCDREQILAHITGTGGDVNSTADDTTADLSSPFQAASCASLGFGPKFTMKMTGGRQAVKRSKNLGVVINLKPRAGDANLKSTALNLSSAIQVDQRHLGNICSERELSQSECAGRQQIGSATAITPLLDQPLTGPLYAVSGGGGLPRLVFILHGDVTILIGGKTTSVGNHLRTVFNTVPDAPITSFQLRIDGGKHGYLVNTRNLCRKPVVSGVQLAAQNGDQQNENVRMKVPCGNAKQAKRGG